MSMVKRKSVKKTKMLQLPEGTTSIFVTTQVEGIHYWSKAWKDKLLNVNYLKHPHRHMFHLKLELQVYNDDRELEFLVMKRWLNIIGQKIFGDLAHLKPIPMSCEMIAKEILKEVQKFVSSLDDDRIRSASCEVSEDGENGAIVSVMFCRWS